AGFDVFHQLLTFLFTTPLRADNHYIEDRNHDGDPPEEKCTGCLFAAGSRLRSHGEYCSNHIHDVSFFWLLKSRLATVCLPAISPDVFKCSVANRLTDFLNKIIVPEQIVDGQQPYAQHFVDIQQMPDIRPAKMPACIASAIFLYRRERQ